MKGFSVWCFLIFYAFPCIIFLVAYGWILVTLYARKRQTDLASSRVIDTATRQLTRTAAIVTVWFTIALGYDLWYYVLGHNGVRGIKYVKNTPIQKAGIFLTSTNSIVNPIIYCLFMPAFRKSVHLTFFSRFRKPGEEKQSTSSTTMNSSL